MANRWKDLEGKVVGFLTVLSRAEGTTPQRDILWNVCCVCGKNLVKRASELGKRASSRAEQVPQSCGCKRMSLRVYTSKYGSAGHLGGHHFGLIQIRARRKGFVFDVTIEYLWEKFQKQDGKCALSGAPLFLSKKSALPDETRGSLDRIDSKVGYVVGNVQWVHPTLNFMKHAMPQANFIEWCRRVAEHN